jgi:hypothetical protein
MFNLGIGIERGDITMSAHIGHQQTPKKPLENDIFKN